MIQDIAAAALDQLSVGVVILDEDLKIVTANAPALRHFNEIRIQNKLEAGSDLSDIEELFRNDRVLVRALYNVEGLGRKVGVRPLFSLSSNIADVSYELKRLTVGDADGGLRFLIQIRERHRSISSVRADNNERRRERIAASIERRHAKQLDALNRNLDRFAYAAAHDMQEPVRIVGLLADRMLREGEQLSAAQKDKFLRSIHLHARRARIVVRDILDFSEVKNSDLDLSDVDLSSVVRTVWKEAVENLPEGIEASLRLGELPIAHCDRRMIAVLFRNLISNSVKYRRGDTVQVAIDIEDFGDRRRINFADKGQGFDPAHASKIFEPFVRLQRKDEIEGSGVGLSLCQSIVERHGGRLTATGAPGDGATFSIELPRR